MTDELSPQMRRQIDDLERLVRVGMVGASNHFQWNRPTRDLPHYVQAQLWVEAALGYLLGHELIVVNGNPMRETTLEIPRHLHPNQEAIELAYRQRARDDLANFKARNQSPDG